MLPGWGQKAQRELAAFANTEFAASQERGARSRERESCRQLATFSKTEFAARKKPHISPAVRSQPSQELETPELSRERGLKRPSSFQTPTPASEAARALVPKPSLNPKAKTSSFQKRQSGTGRPLAAKTVRALQLCCSGFRASGLGFRVWPSRSLCSQSAPCPPDSRLRAGQAPQPHPQLGATAEKQMAGLETVPENLQTAPDRQAQTTPSPKAQTPKRLARTCWSSSERS